jgi:hypothetical protein
VFPAFSPSVPESQYAGLGVKKLEVNNGSKSNKKAIRRSALEIKKSQEQEEQKQSLQEKEWEIPAFLRFKK